MQELSVRSFQERELLLIATGVSRRTIQRNTDLFPEKILPKEIAVDL